MMSNLLLVLFFIFLFLMFLILFFNYKKKCNRLKKIKKFSFLISPAKEQEFNPDINTNNWDLHKIRLKKFGRSHYKGLTFFISPEDRIYYFTEKGTKVYC